MFRIPVHIVLLISLDALAASDTSDLVQLEISKVDEQLASTHGQLQSESSLGDSHAPQHRRSSRLKNEPTSLADVVDLEREAGLDLYASLGFMYTPTVNANHPMWEFDWARLAKSQVVYCGTVLALAGVLCAAGGIGGGGVYVTVLMVVGQLSVRDAVPLSKAVVFVGSISSLLLNMRKTFQSADDNSVKSVIDYNICRLVVPASLLGTYFGVVLNQIVPSIVILTVLTTMLLVMSCMVMRTAYNQLKAELTEIPPTGGQPSSSSSSPSGPSSGPRLRSSSSTQPWKSASSVHQATGTKELALNLSQAPQRSQLTKADVLLSMSSLIVVVMSGAFHFHASRCKHQLNPDQVNVHLPVPECHHPVFQFAGNGLQHLMISPSSSFMLTTLSILLPFIFCSTVMCYYTAFCVSAEGWQWKETFGYTGMAATTGCLAGLVGIGGGLIFSPFFLIMNVDPAVAVATSSTCVIFIASSTALQYLLTDRIIMVLALFYGIQNLVASYVGTKLVHFLQDHYGTRKSFISSIVAVGVVLSAALSAYKIATTNGL